MTCDLHEALRCTDRTEAETRHLVRLMGVIIDLPEPPRSHELFPRYPVLKRSLLDAIDRGEGEEIEECFLELYAHLHMHEAPYTQSERRRVDATGGYWCHAGGLSPILKAEPWIRPVTTSADLGAGNGLQCLLLHRLFPHARTIQIEISSRMVEIGKLLQTWLDVPPDRVEWVVGDVTEIMPEGYDFLYLYRPVRPEGAGRRFYTALAENIEAADREIIVFSIADCLRSFFSDAVETVYSDGHLTCFRKAARDGLS